MTDGMGAARAIDIYTEVAGFEKPSGSSTLAGLATKLAHASGSGPVPGALTRPEQGPSGLTIQTASKEHCIVAPALCLWARSTEDLDASIIMQTDSKGCISVLSGAATTIAGGTSTVLALKDGDTGGSVTLDCGGADATLTLQSGPEGAKNNTLTLAADGAKLKSKLNLTLSVGIYRMAILTSAS